jgi:hypothetical protein
MPARHSYASSQGEQKKEAPSGETGPMQTGHVQSNSFAEILWEFLSITLLQYHQKVITGISQ